VGSGGGGDAVDGVPCRFLYIEVRYGESFRPAFHQGENGVGDDMDAAEGHPDTALRGLAPDFAGGDVGPADEAQIAGGEEEESVVRGLGVGDEQGREGSGAGLRGEPCEVEVCEDVGVVGEEGGGSFGGLRMTGGCLRMRGRGVQQRPGELYAAAGLEGLGTGLAGDVHIHPGDGPGSQEFFYAGCFVAGVHDNLGESGVAQPHQDPFEHGYAPDLHHRLGDVPGDAPESGSEARSENKSFHVTKIIIIFA